MEQMLLSNRKPIAVTFTDEDVTVTLSDGTKVSNPLDWHWWLNDASPEQRANYELYSDAIVWPDLDEGLDIEGMLRGIKPRRVSHQMREI